MSNEERYRQALEEYISFLETSENHAFIIAKEHGYVCSSHIVEKGNAMRLKIYNLREALNIPDSLTWFNIGSRQIKFAGRHIKLWNCFNRVCADGDHYWGFGIVQIGMRHLFYIGHSGISIFWVGKTR